MTAFNAFRCEFGLRIYSFGLQNFTHGIDILTAADYYTLGNRNDSYIGIARFIAGFAEYRRPIIDHLQSIKLFHWDIDIRVLASKSLHELTPMDTEFTIQTVIPHLFVESTNSELNVRHGAVLGMSEIVLALRNDLPDEVLAELAELVAKLEKLRLYRGRGGEIMRAAVCRYVECISLAQIPLTVKQQVGSKFLVQVLATVVLSPPRVVGSTARFS